MLKHRHCVGQRDDLPQSIDPEAQLAGLVVVPAVDADVAFLPSGKGCEAQYVACRIFGLELAPRSEEHTSELQSLMRISYAVFCLNKKHDHRHNRADQDIDMTDRQYSDTS